MSKIMPAMADVAELFNRMDAQYRKVAQANGFECRGCEDNCCRTLFDHHTLVEYLYIKDGLSQLPVIAQEQVRQRAAEVVRQSIASAQGASPANAMCPLNENERCLLYGHRPMICRLHGIAHTLRRPDGQRRQGPGCGDFERQCALSANVPLDRTPLYIALAELEKKVRRRLGFDRKIKMTIARMVVENIEL